MSSASPPPDSHSPDSRARTGSPTEEPGEETLVTASTSRALTPPVTPASDPGRVFADDELVAYRYRIRGLLGRGGMGEVYEAEDCELRERVALKVLRHELAERPDALELLKREIALARKVSHPHVCRIFDVGFHLRAAGQERIAFLSMELLQGEPLSAVLRRDGPLSPNEALHLVRQMAEGLGAAHEAGIIHRDLKSANVLLIRSPTGETPRAVITDFGLAQAMGDAAPEHSAPGTRRSGTPAYMAPEQLEGKPLSARTDLYALGIILFEMLTGTRPFTGEDTKSTVLQRLHTPAPSPRQFRPGLDTRWEALVLRALEREPARRFQSARELIAALPPPLAPAPAPSRPRRWSRTLPRLLALGLGSLLAGIHPRALPPRPLRATRLATARPMVALFGFSGPTGRSDTAWLPAALTHALRTELLMDDQLLLLSSELSTAKTVLSLPDTGPLTPDTLARLHAFTGCDLVMRGSYSVEESGGSPRLRLEFELQRASTGAAIASFTESGPLREPLPLISRLGGRIREALGLQTKPSATPLGNLIPSNLEALQLLAEGNAKYQQSDATTAVALFQRAIELAPHSLAPRTALASALLGTGARDRAVEHLGALLADPGPLTLRERLLLKSMYYRYTDRTRMLEPSQTLFELHPDSPDIGLNLVDAQLVAGRAEAALSTLATLRERFPAPCYTTRIDLLEAKAALEVSAHSRAQAAAARAATQAEAWRNWSLAGECRRLEATAWKRQGAKERALESIHHAVRLQQRAGNRHAEADAISQLAELLPEEDLRGRLQVSQEALSIYREQGLQHGVCMRLVGISDNEYALGEPRAALHTAEESLPSCRATRQPNVEMNRLFVTGQAHRALGDLNSAGSSFQEQLDLARKHENKTSMAMGLTGLAEVLLARGDLAQARRLSAEARELLHGLKRQDLERELAVDLLRARIAFEEGLFVEAARLTAEAESSVSAGPPAATVHHLRARIALAQGNPREARISLLHAGEPALLMLRLGLHIQRARLEALYGAAPEREAALKHLQEILEEARGREWFEGQLEARLALGEVELASGKTRAGLARLEALERDAQKKGWWLWARKAASLRTSTKPR
ncbi:protein kinase [Cystobacter fuscus]|uniref:protein kinase domain-containing protein n=1 Tax=Cystobacter fuscus TaxID=43 RepID=UPI002B2FCDA0|nr:protein kinase [Cystobacter fuscus]